MTTIHKFELRTGATTELKLPYGAQISRVDMQYGHPMVWIHLDPTEPYVVPYEFAIVPTGHPVPDGFHVVSTFFDYGGALVWHACVRVGPIPRSVDVRRTLGERELMNG